MRPGYVSPKIADLSPRQQQIVACVARGLANKEIAAELRITAGTVKQYLHMMFEQYGFENRTEIAVWFLEQGLSAGPTGH